MSSSSSGQSPSPSDSSGAQQDKPSEPPSSSSWSSWFVSPSTLRDRFQEFDDQQRIDRLSECRKLEKILHNCRKRHQPGKPKSRYKKNTDNEDPIESISIGVRNMKYFGWRGILNKSSSPSAQQKDPSANSETADAGDTSDKRAKASAANDGPDISVFYPKIRSSCAREEHAVWACRAISTGCGKDLSELKKCFDDVDHHDTESEPNTGGSRALPQHVRVLTSPFTNYVGLVEKVGEPSDRKNVVSVKEQIPCYEIQWRLGSCVTENGKQLLERKQQREGRQQQQQQKEL